MKSKLFKLLVGLTFYSFAFELLRIYFGDLSLPPTVLIIIVAALISLKIFFKFDQRICNFVLLNCLFLSIVLFSGVINGEPLTLLFLVKYLIGLVLSILVYKLATANLQELESTYVTVLFFSSISVFVHCAISFLVLKSSYLSGSLFIVTEVGKNQLAAYMAIISVLNFGLIIYCREKYHRTILFFTFFIHFLALLYTGSRSGFISFAISSFILFAISELKIKRKIQIFCLGGVLSIIALVILFSHLDSTIQNMLVGNVETIIMMKDQGDSTSISVRGNLITIGLNLFAESPIWGNGIVSYFDKVGIASHNTYIQILSELGVMGFLSYFFIALYVLYSAYRSNKMLFGVYLCLLLSMIFQNILDSMFAFLIMGLALVTNNKAEKVIGRN